MRRLLVPIIAVLSCTAALAQPAPQAFVPITIDAARFQELDAAIGKLSMPRDAHIALRGVLDELEQRAKAEADAHATSHFPTPGPQWRPRLTPGHQDKP